MTTASLAFLIAVAAAAAILTGLIYRYALAFGVLDIPNPRSAHSVPTPRGGGVAIMAAFLGAVAWLAGRGLVDITLATALLLGGAAISLLGFIDDHRPLGVRWRLAVQFAIGAGVVAVLGGIGPIIVAGRPIDLSWAGALGAVLGLVWLINIYNFMDGIDGLAATQAVTSGIVAAWLYAADPLVAGQWRLPAALAAAAGGFLAWNWPPARIFMGDAGSGFFGLVIGILIIRAGQAQPSLFWAWLIMLAVFVVDTSVTLIERTWRREVLHHAHHQHAYQYAARQFTHRRVTVAVAAVNLLWLAPLALAVSSGVLDGALAVAIAYAPLILIARRIKVFTRA